MNMKRKFATLTVTLLILSCNAVPTLAEDNASGFADLRDHWAKSSVATAISKKYVDGYGDGTFRPENYVTTAEFIKMVVTAAKLPMINDGSTNEWFVPYVKAAVDKGIVREDGLSTAVLGAPISRLEMAKIAVRATDSALQQAIVNVNDQGVMYTATSKGLVQGMSDGDLAPNGSTTRAQSVTVIERILSVNNGDKLEVDKKAFAKAELALKRTNLFSMIPVFGGEQSNGYEWSPEKLVLETADGKFKGEIEQVVAIDMADKNDPNRYLLGDVSRLHWYNGSDGAYKDMPLVQDYPDSYVIVVKSRVDYVKDTEAYSADGRVAFTIYGFESPDKEALAKGELNTLSTVFQNKRGDTAMYILPKKGYKVESGALSIKLSAPARPSVGTSTRTITVIPVSK